MQQEKKKSIVVLSGGQDSVTTFYQALQESDVVAAVHFFYGQRHAIERDCAAYHAEKADVPLIELPIEALSLIGNSGLLSTGADINAPHAKRAHLPASFVPGRNLLFLTLAAAQAMKLDAVQVWTGVCQADFSGYPDCRQDTLDALQTALRLGMEFPELELLAPLMNLTKAQTFARAESLGVLESVIEFTHTCYNGDAYHRHNWGYGCGHCPSCRVRARGWAEYQANTQ